MAVMGAESGSESGWGGGGGCRSIVMVWGWGGLPGG